MFLMTNEIKRFYNMFVDYFYFFYILAVILLRVSFLLRYLKIFFNLHNLYLYFNYL